jgi:hypothetical protein
MDYNVTLKKEVLSEFAAGLLAKYWRYMDANGIDKNDSSDSTALLAKDISFLKKSILNDCRTLDDLKVVEIRFSYIRSIIERLQENRQLSKRKETYYVKL